MEGLVDAFLRRQIYLLRFAAGLGSRMVAYLDQTEFELKRELDRRVAQFAQVGLDPGPATTKRLETLREAIAAVRDVAFASIKRLVTGELKDMAAIEAEKTAEILAKVAPKDLQIEAATARELGAIVEAKPFEGAVLKDWIDRLAENDTRRISDQVIIGMIANEPNEKIARRIFGTAAQQGKDGTLAVSRNGARALARTATNHVSNQSRQLVYQANADILKQERFLATLDARTTPLCRSLDGNTYPLGEGPIPPLHWNCRSVRVPFFGEVQGNRAALGGPVDGKLTYQTWLARQTPAFQDEVLGVSKGKLFRDGKLTLDRFVDENGEEYTLAELRRREPAAWARAFPE